MYKGEETKPGRRREERMSKHVPKSLQGYFSKIKKETRNIQFSSNSFSSSKNWVLSGCKRPKTLSFAMHHKRRNHKTNSLNSNQSNDKDKEDSEAATLADVDRFLYENFRSLYIKDEEENKDDDKEELENQSQEKSSLGAILFDSPRFLEPPPDLHGSNRFFVRPASSGLLTDEARQSMTTTTTAASFDDAASSSDSCVPNAAGSSGNEHTVLPEDCIAVLKYTPDPYQDFKRSMLEMAESRLATQRGAKVDWDFLEELLICYLDLNDKKLHRFILSAFADLIVVLRQNRDRNSRRCMPPRSPRSPSLRTAKGRIRARHVA